MRILSGASADARRILDAEHERLREERVELKAALAANRENRLRVKDLLSQCPEALPVDAAPTREPLSRRSQPPAVFQTHPTEAAVLQFTNAAVSALSHLASTLPPPVLSTRARKSVQLLGQNASAAAAVVTDDLSTFADATLLPLTVPASKSYREPLPMCIYNAKRGRLEKLTVRNMWDAYHCGIPILVDGKPRMSTPLKLHGTSVTASAIWSVPRGAATTWLSEYLRVIRALMADAEALRSETRDDAGGTDEDRAAPFTQEEIDESVDATIEHFQEIFNDKGGYRGLLNYAREQYPLAKPGDDADDAALPPRVLKRGQGPDGQPPNKKKRNA